MDGHRLRALPRAPEDDPRRPTSPARRRPSIRENVDRELRSAVLACVSRRPSEAWDNLARGETRPAGKLPERLMEAATHGAARERVKAALVAAVVRAVDITFDGVANAA